MERPHYQGMTPLAREVEEWLLILPSSRLVTMLRTVSGQERITGAGNHYTLVQFAAKSAEAKKADAFVKENGRLPPELEKDMTPKQIAAAVAKNDMEGLVGRYNELTPNKPITKFKNIEAAGERVTAAEEKAKADFQKKKEEEKAAKAKEKEANKAAKASGAPRGPRAADLRVTYKEGGTSAVRESSNRGAVFALIKEAGAKGILKSELDAKLGYATEGYIQKLDEKAHVTVEKIAAAVPAADATPAE